MIARPAEGESRLALGRQRERAFVQEGLAQISMYHHVPTTEKLASSAERLCYARQAMERGWSHNSPVLRLQSANVSKLSQLEGIGIL